MKKNVMWLSEISEKDKLEVGTKGYNISELYNSKLPVPNAFCITNKVFQDFLKENKLKDEISRILGKIDIEDLTDLEKKSEEIKELIISGEVSKKIESEILEAYDHLNVDLTSFESSPGALAILKSSREPIFVSVRGSFTDDSNFCCDNFINVKGNPDLIEKIKLCFASVFSPRSIYYRFNKLGDEFFEFAIVIQKMIDSDKSGVIFTRNPVGNENEILIESVFGQGEGISSGRIKPDKYLLDKELEILSEEISEKRTAIVRTAGGQTKTISLTEEKSSQRVLKTHELKQIAQIALKLEEKFGPNQEIEFAIQDDEFYLLQKKSDSLEPQNEEKDFDGNVIAKGNGVSKGISSGIVRIINSLEDLGKVKRDEILMMNITKKDIVTIIRRISGLITLEGGVSSIFSSYSRKMKIPSVAGIQENENLIQDGNEISIDGYSGKIFSGKAQDKRDEIVPLIKTKTKIRLIIENPRLAKKASDAESWGIGLIPLEKLVYEYGISLEELQNEKRLEEYRNFLERNIEGIVKNFLGKSIWIRLSDISGDSILKFKKFSEQPEKNPLLGNRGIKFLIKHPNILKSEALAIESILKKGYDIKVLLPQVVSVEEIRAVKKLFSDWNIDLKIGIMIETPAASILIKDICNEGIDFVLFDLNDLAQYTLAVDFSNPEIEGYGELNWAVLKQVSRVIRECKLRNIETSVMGKTLTEEKMLDFLIKQEIDSLTVHINLANEISQKVNLLEGCERVEEKPEEKWERKIEPLDNIEEIREEINELENLEQERLQKMKDGTVTEIIDETP